MTAKSLAQSLARRLQPQRLDGDVFVAPKQGPGGPTRIYGGQIIGQCLAAAYATVPEDRACHSIHSCFLRAGQPNKPVLYEVERARDGGSFATRRVTAVQDGQQILHMSASFHVQEQGWDHQHPMPGAPGPDQVQSSAGFVAQGAARDTAEASNAHHHRGHFEIRDIDPMDELNPQPADDRHGFWFRMAAAADSTAMEQQLLLAYASDIALMGVGLRPQGLTWSVNKVMGASLDHALWFHEPTRLQDWHLYMLESPWTGHGRSFARGMIYRQDGTLVASATQESLMRPKKQVR